MKTNNPTYNEASQSHAIAERSNTIGGRLQQVRGALSQHDFAESLGETKGLISQFEQGKALPSVYFLQKIKLILDVDMNWFLTGLASKPRD